MDLKRETLTVYKIGEIAVNSMIVASFKFISV